MVNYGLGRIAPDMAVVCSHDKQFAIVDAMEGNDWIRLKQDERGKHHFIPVSWVRAVDDKVHIDRPMRQAMQQWSAIPSYEGMNSSPRIRI
jgi:hypothetical protein